jgi:hypothetical protein
MLHGSKAIHAVSLTCDVPTCNDDAATNAHHAVHFLTPVDQFVGMGAIQSGARARADRDRAPAWEAAGITWLNIPSAAVVDRIAIFLTIQVAIVRRNSQCRRQRPIGIPLIQPTMGIQRKFMHICAKDVLWHGVIGLADSLR